MKHILLSTTFLFVLVVCDNNATEPNSLQSKADRNTPMKQLYNDLFNDYKKDVRPVLDDRRSVNMSVKFWLKQILKVNEADQILTVYIWLELYWEDEYLRWNPIDFDNITSMHVPADSVWQPDLLVYNNANMNIEENELETNVLVMHTGAISLFRSVITDITCKLDLTYFPFDEQACYIMLASWSLDASKMALKQKNPMARDYLQFYINNSEWNLEDFQARQNNRIYECCEHPYPDLSYYFVLSRNPAYYILSLIIPSAFITVVTIIGFFTPHSSTGENNEKVSLGVTALLSMAIIMMMVADEIPATSKTMPLIGKYYIGLIFILFAAAFSTTLTLSIQMRGISDAPPSAWVRRLYFDVLARCVLISFMLPECPKRHRRTTTCRPAKTRTLKLNATQQSITSKTRPLLTETSFHYIPREAKEQNGALIWQKMMTQKDADSDNNDLDVDTTEAPDMSEMSPSVELQIDESHAAQLIEKPLSRTASTKASDVHTKLVQMLPVGVLNEIKFSVASIRNDLHAKLKRENIAREWRQIARITERTMMILFILWVTLFAFFMLSGRADKIQLTSQRLDELSKIE